MDEYSAKVLSILEDHGITTPYINVYYAPTREIDLLRPCIVYMLKSINVAYANNKPYRITRVFSLTLLTDIHGEPFRDQIMAIPQVSHIQTYVVSDVVHDIFEITI